MSSDKRKTFTLLTEKYRPSIIKEMVLPKSLKAYFTKLVNEGEIPNLLLHSSNPGSGKTSVAGCLINELEAEYIVINCSLTNGVEMVREQIIGFSTCASFSDKRKIVWMEEVDGLSHQSQLSLRAVLEECHTYCRFILTCNSISRLLEPIVSRCQIIDFNFQESEQRAEMEPKIVKHLLNILKNEKIEYDPEVIPKLVSKYYCDMRKILNVIQQVFKQNSIIDSSVLSYETISDELIDLILTKKFTKAREHIIQSNYNISDLYGIFYRQLVPKLSPEKRPEITILLADYDFKSKFCNDQELNISACLYELMGGL